MEPFKPIDTMSFGDPVCEAHEVTPKEAPPKPALAQAFSVRDIAKVRYVCKVGVKQGDERVECGGVVEGTPQEIMNNKEYKWKFACPKCKAEFSRGMRFHVQTDQAKGVAEMTHVLQSAPFEVQFVLKTATGDGEGPQPPKAA